MTRHPVRSKRPNILFLLADDQRHDTIGALGNSEVMTPTLDRLVRAGFTFTQAHIPGGTVGAVCMPSRAMLHTGRTLFALEQHGQRIPQTHALLGEVLRQEGYRTCGIGKWHNGPDAYARSFTDGAEIFFGGMWDHWNVPACAFDPTGQYAGRSKHILDPMRTRSTVRMACDHIRPGKHSTELFADAAVDWLNGYESEQPFFLYVSFMAPHDPRSMPERFRERYDPQRLRLPENFLPEHPFDYGIRGIRDELLAPQPRTEADVREHLADYYGMISHLDEETGRILSTLKRRGLDDNTIIVYCADNGLALGQHGLFGKQSAYEHSIRVPLSLSGPGIPQGERSGAYVYLLDLFPTLCELAGVQIPPSVQGISFAPALGDSQWTGRETLYAAYESKVRAVKDNQYKLIQYRTAEGVRTQLFDLRSDPGERWDLSGQEAFKTIEARLREELLRYKSEWKDEQHPAGALYWQQQGGTEG
ncbi:sulfatase-like hydrolase/transferase [Paenibacillus sp. 1P07SE]|uniref:sulfatase-like hydrolase/transferase n=1 Tax=Paenibacillus sp. 1P07SE TaxID=3132209 RepID=UPI0039A5DAF1